MHPSGCTSPRAQQRKGAEQMLTGPPRQEARDLAEPTRSDSEMSRGLLGGILGKTQSQVGPTVTHDVHHVARPRPGSSLCYPGNSSGNLKSSNYKRSKTRPGPDVFTCEFTKHEEPAALLKLWDKLKNISSLILGGQHYPDIKPRQRHHKKNDRPISLMSITGKVLKKMPAE